MSPIDDDQREFNRLNTEWWAEYFGKPLAEVLKKGRKVQVSQSEKDCHNGWLANESRVKYVQARLSNGNRFKK